MEDYGDLKMVNAEKDELELGKWVQHPNNPNVQLCIARFNNPTYLTAYVKALKSGAPYDDCIMIAMAEGILVDWTGFIVLDGDEEVNMDYSHARALTVFRNDTITLDFVTSYCQADAHYIKKGLTSVKKKCSPISSGGSSGEAS